MYSQRGSLGGARVEERLVGEEIISNTSSGDVTETEEHVTVHAKREPLPWSLRDPSYNKPLPGIVSVSPVPSMHSMESSVSREMKREGAVSPIMGVGVPASPLSSRATPSSASFRSPRVAEGAGGEHVTALSSPGSLSYLGGEKEGSPVIGRTPASSGERADAELNHSPVALFQSHSPASMTPPTPAASSPHPAMERGAGAPVVGVMPPASPVYSASPNDADVSLEEGTPPLEEVGRPLSGFDEEANTESVPFVAVPLPQSAGRLINEGFTGSPQGPIASSPATKGASGGPTMIPPPVAITIQSPASSAPTKTPPLPTAAKSSAVREESSVPFRGVTVVSSADEARETAHYSLGDKRGRSPYSINLSSVSIESDLRADGHRSVQHIDRRLWAKYRKDWRVRRSHPPERYFFPPLFNATRLQYVHIPRRRRPIPRAFQQLVEDHQDPGAKYRRDWQVERHFPITRYFNPQLFDVGHLRRVKIPAKRREKKRAFAQRMRALGISDVNSPASRLRRDWQVHRHKPVECFFEPSLFDSIIPVSQRLREDWYSLRPRPVETFYNPVLLSEAYCRRKARNVHFMIARLRSPMPWKYRPRRPVYRDPGEKYRQDWQVHRANDLLLYWDPTIFDLDLAERMASYWHDFILHYNQAHHGAPTASAHPTPTSPHLQGHAFSEPLGYYGSPEELWSSSAQDAVGDTIEEGRGVPPLLAIEESPTSWGMMEQERDEEEYGEGARATILETIRELKAANEYSPEGSLYDWPFWEECLRGDTLDDQQRSDLLVHLQSLDYAGVPELVRPALWLLLSGAHSAPQLYGEYEVLRGMPSPWEDSINGAIEEIRKSWDLSADEVIDLHFVLSAHANFDPECGFSPLLVPLAATLLQVAGDDGDAFVMLACITQNFNHRRHLLPAVGGCDLLLFQLDHLLVELDPQLAAHLGHLGVDASTFARSWYGSLCFASDQAFSHEVLDLFLLEGYAGLHQTALTLLVENRNRLLRATDFASLMAVLEGDLLVAHVDWSLADWRWTIGQVVVLREELAELEEEYHLLQESAHEFGCLQKLAGLEQEHDELLQSLQSTLVHVREVCLAREQLTAEVLEARHDQKKLLEQSCRQTQQMAEAHREMNELHLAHQKEERRLSVRIEELSLPAAAAPRRADSGTRIYKV